MEALAPSSRLECEVWSEEEIDSCVDVKVFYEGEIVFVKAERNEHVNLGEIKIRNGQHMAVGETVIESRRKKYNWRVVLDRPGIYTAEISTRGRLFARKLRMSIEIATPAEGGVS